MTRSASNEILPVTVWVASIISIIFGSCNLGTAPFLNDAISRAGCDAWIAECQFARCLFIDAGRAAESSSGIIWHVHCSIVSTWRDR